MDKINKHICEKVERQIEIDGWMDGWRGTNDPRVMGPFANHTGGAIQLNVCWRKIP
jgi:hypothetical protein